MSVALPVVAVLVFVGGAVCGAGVYRRLRPVPDSAATVAQTLRTLTEAHAAGTAALLEVAISRPVAAAAQSDVLDAEIVCIDPPTVELPVLAPDANWYGRHHRWVS
jgi:hypothetical protein